MFSWFGYTDGFIIPLFGNSINQITLHYLQGKPHLDEMAI